MKFTKPVIAALAVTISNNSVGAIITGPIVNPNNNNTYYLLSASNWTQAETEAISIGGNLVTINDKSENDWVYSTFDGANNDLWIGYNDIATEGDFVWSSGEISSYTNWYVGEPNNTFGVEDYAVMRKSLYGAWIDYSNDATIGGGGIYGVVEINAVPVPGAAILFASGMIGLLGYARRKNHLGNNK